LNSYYFRKIEDAFEGSNYVSESFELENLSGFQHQITQFYNEFSVRYEPRDENSYIDSGIRIETYSGLSIGLNKDNSRFFRGGFDVMFSLPVIQGNRTVISRIVLDMVKNLEPNVQLPFSEYPRQPSFRGVSGRKIFRTDNYSIIPSIEYQWPVSFNLGGHLFLDYLLVSDNMVNFSNQNPPWVFGFGIDFHGIDAELARMQVAYGSEGFRFLLSVGTDSLFNDRVNCKLIPKVSWTRMISMLSFEE